MSISVIMRGHTSHSFFGKKSKVVKFLWRCGMKNKITFLLVLSTSALLFSACQGLNNDEPTDLEESVLDEIDRFDGVSMSALGDSVTPTSMTVEFENDSEQQVIYSE